MRYLSILAFLITLLTALPSHAGLYAKDFNMWEGEWGYNNDPKGYVDSGSMTISNCNKNICSIDIYTNYGHIPVNSCELNTELQISGNNGVILADDDGNEHTDSGDCFTLKLDKENARLIFTLKDGCNDNMYCGARGHLHSQTLQSEYIKPGKNVKTYAASYKCENLSSVIDIHICQNKELAALDIELDDIYKYRKTTDDGIVKSQREWLKERNSSSAPALAKLYANRTYELARELDYAPPKQQPRYFENLESHGLYTLPWIRSDYTYDEGVKVNDEHFNISREFRIDNCQNNVCEFTMTLGMEHAFYYPEPLYTGKGRFTAKSSDSGEAKNILFTNVYKYTTESIEKDESTPTEISKLRRTQTTTCTLLFERQANTDTLLIKPANTPECRLPKYFFTALSTSSESKAPFYKTGYDCYKAGNLAEKTVCAVETLANLDIELASLYKDASALSPEIKAAQKEWIKKKNACKADKDCLDYEYKRRIIDLYKVLRTKK